MNKKFKKVFLTVLLLLFITSPLLVKADSGWDSSYSSGHSSSGSRSKSSSSSSRSRSSSSSSKNRSSSSGTSSSSSSSSSDSSSSIFFVIAILVLISLPILIPFIIVMIAVIVSKRNKKNVINYSEMLYKDISIEKLNKVLNNTSLDYLKNVTYERFLAIQDAWMNFDYKKLRELCTDELYNSYKAQLETLKLKKGQNIMSDFDKQQINITDIKEEDGKVAITVYLRVSFYDYVINTKSKEVIRGTKSKKITNNYIMTFVRGKDAISIINYCPNCGSPVKDTASSKCDYCGADIVKDSSEFVLSKKTNINK